MMLYNPGLKKVQAKFRYEIILSLACLEFFLAQSI